MGLFIKAVNVLIAIGFVLLAYLVVVWVLGMFGLAVPDQILRIIFVIFGLIAIVGALQGRWDNYWLHPPKE